MLWDQSENPETPSDTVADESLGKTVLKVALSEVIVVSDLPSESVTRISEWIPSSEDINPPELSLSSQRVPETITPLLIVSRRLVAGDTMTSVEERKPPSLTLPLVTLYVPIGSMMLKDPSLAVSTGILAPSADSNTR
jgi:hypothetical protein